MRESVSVDVRSAAGSPTVTLYCSLPMVKVLTLRPPRSVSSVRPITVTSSPRSAALVRSISIRTSGLLSRKSVSRSASPGLSLSFSTSWLAIPFSSAYEADDWMTNCIGLPKPRTPSDAGFEADAWMPAIALSFGSSFCTVSCWLTVRSLQSLRRAKEFIRVTSPAPTIKSAERRSGISWRISSTCSE